VDLSVHDKAKKKIKSDIVILADTNNSLYTFLRLVYWLSNTAVLRVIISQTTKQLDIISLTSISGSGTIEEKNRNMFGSAAKKKTASLWESVYRKRGKLLFTEELEHWADPATFLSALSKTESWIFSRILESVWWQVREHIVSIYFTLFLWKGLCTKFLSAASFSDPLIE
jgi:hypothetical protein